MSELVMAGLISASIGALGIIVNAIINRRRDREQVSATHESHEITRIELLLNKQETMIAALEGKVDELEKEVESLKAERDKDRAEYKSELTKIRKVVRDYLSRLLSWDQHREDPLPLPSDSDLELLEITLPPRIGRK